MSRAVSEATFVEIQNGAAGRLTGTVPTEEQIILYVNAAEWVGLMCTPTLLEELALGFLYNEGLIDGLGDVADVRVCGSGRCVDAWLHRDVALPSLRTITSGCSGGTTFESLVDARRPVASELRVAADQILQLMQQLQRLARRHRRAHGIHVSALARGTELACVAEDVGRHNTVDKLAGTCLRKGAPTRGGILLTSGRISSEMLAKAARMEVPVVVSRTSPTSRSVELARAWDITLVGYARRKGFRVYAGAHRIADPDRAGARPEPGTAR